MEDSVVEKAVGADAYSKDISDALRFRRATSADVAAIADILRMAVARMLADGKQQWNESYPTEIHVRDDIEKGNGYVLEWRGVVAAYCAVVFSGEPAYASIDGKWLSEGNYVVAHRLAVSRSMTGKGFGRTVMQAIEDYAVGKGVKSFRVDTNFDNSVMLHLIDSLGFTYCGEIRYEGGCRKAFEKLIGGGL